MCNAIMIENSLIDEFLNYLKFERHFSPHTAKCYAADLAQFCAFLVGDPRPPARQNLAAAMRSTSGEARAARATAPEVASP